MEKVLVIGLIAVPLVLFLALFSDRVLTNTDANAETAKKSADALMEAVTE